MTKSNGVISLQQCTEIIDKACKGSEALGFAKEISAFHRIQASRGYRAAALRTARLLRENGLEVCIHSYPADG